MVLLCLILVISTVGKPVIITEPYPGETGTAAQETVPPQEAASPQTPAITSPADNGTQQKKPDPNGQRPDNPIQGDTMIFKPGTYSAGADIPAGYYVAVNDGSSKEATVTIRGSQYAGIEIPEIIVTSRYVKETGSFTSRPNYVEAVRRGGGEPVQPGDDPELAAFLRGGDIEYAETLAERYDGLLLTGGGDIAAHFFNQEHHPASNTPDEILDAAELALCRAFIRAGKPVLGICRGMQVLNVATGGELIQDIPDILDIPRNVHHGETVRHDITIRPGTWLYSLVGPGMETNSLHHQCVDGVSQGFSVVAFTGPVIEAMERGNLLGTQFHPERMLDEGMTPLFEDFIYRCSFDDIKIEIFTTHTIINIRENQHVDVEGAYLQRIESTSGMFEQTFVSNGFYPEGLYLAGTHLPEGRYKLSAVGDVIFSSYIVYNDLSHDSIADSGSLSESDKFVELLPGQYIKLINAAMTPG